MVAGFQISIEPARSKGLPSVTPLHDLTRLWAVRKLLAQTARPISTPVAADVWRNKEIQAPVAVAGNRDRSAGVRRRRLRSIAACPRDALANADDERQRHSARPPQEHANTERAALPQAGRLKNNMPAAWFPADASKRPEFAGLPGQLRTPQLSSSRIANQPSWTKRFHGYPPATSGSAIHGRWNGCRGKGIPTQESGNARALRKKPGDETRPKGPARHPCLGRNAVPVSNAARAGASCPDPRGRHRNACHAAARLLRKKSH